MERFILLILFSTKSMQYPLYLIRIWYSRKMAHFSCFYQSIFPLFCNMNLPCICLLVNCLMGILCNFLLWNLRFSSAVAKTRKMNENLISSFISLLTWKLAENVYLHIFLLSFYHPNHIFRFWMCSKFYGNIDVTAHLKRKYTCDKQVWYWNSMSLNRFICKMSLLQILEIFSKKMWLVNCFCSTYFSWVSLWICQRIRVQNILYFE